MCAQSYHFTPYVFLLFFCGLSSYGSQGIYSEMLPTVRSKNCILKHTDHKAHTVRCESKVNSSWANSQ